MLENCKVLFVNSENEMITKMKDSFNDICKYFYTAVSAEEAYHIMNMKDFDILITDFILPDNSGIELVKHTKKIRPDIQCIIMTDECSFESAVSALKAGAVDYLSKNVDKEQIIKAIKDALIKKEFITDLQIRILAVEDSNHAMISMIRMLNGLGYYNVIRADSGDTAIKKLIEDKDVKLIISDWYMKNKNGFELLNWVRSQNDMTDIPFIMASAEGEKKQVDKVTKAGANAFLVKPFGRYDLKRVIDDALTKNKHKNDIKVHTDKKTLSKVTIKVAHIPITDHLVLGILKHLINTEQLKPKYFNLKTKRLFHWYPMQRSLEKGDIDAGFILAPIAMDLFSYGIPIKMLLLAHKNGSISVINSFEKITNINLLNELLNNKIFFLPHLLSIQHMLSHKFFSEIGLKPGFVKYKNTSVFYEVVPPVLMPDYQETGSNIGGFMVAEPIGSKAIDDGLVKLLFLSGELWENHPCCVLAMRDEFIEKNTDAVYEFVELLVTAGKYIYENPYEASKIGLSYLDPDNLTGLKQSVLENILKQPNGIKTNDLLPNFEDFELIQKYLHDKIGIGTMIDPLKLIDIRFAESAYKKIGCENSKSKLNDISYIISKILNR